MKRPRTAVDIDAAIEALARDAVNSMIERGFMTADMRDNAGKLATQFSVFLVRDIRTFAETGKYPEYVK